MTPREGSKVVAYNRTAALAYARAYWTKACSDGYVAIKGTPYYRKVDAKTTFVRKVATDPSTEVARLGDGSEIPLHCAPGSQECLEDCTHFVSCCLGNPPGGTGGGIPIVRDFNTIYGRLGANNLYNDLVSQDRVEIVAEKKTYAQALSSLARLEAGDLLFYFDSDRNRYGHSAIYLAGAGKRIACHTYCRGDANNEYAQAWDSVKLPLCTLLKVKANQSLAEFETIDLDDLKGYGQLSNKTGETLLVYGPQNGGSFDNSLYHLPTGRKTPDEWDCDGFYVPNDRYADQALSTVQGPLAIKYLNHRRPVIERTGANYECSLNNGAYKSGELNWEIPNIGYASVPSSYPAVPNHVPA